MQCGVGDSDPAHKNWIQLGHRCELSSASNLDVNAEDLGELLLGWIFVRHRPSGLSSNKPQLLLPVESVNLVHHTINIKGQVFPQAAHVLVKCHQPLSTLDTLTFLGHGEPPSLQGHEDLPVLIDTLRLQVLKVRSRRIVCRFVGHGRLWGNRLKQIRLFTRIIRGLIDQGCTKEPHTIGKKAQRPLGCDSTIELSHGTSRRVAGIDKGFFILHPLSNSLALSLIECLKIASRHVHLASDF